MTQFIASSTINHHMNLQASKIQMSSQSTLKRCSIKVVIDKQFAFKIISKYIEEFKHCYFFQQQQQQPEQLLMENIQEQKQQQQQKQKHCATATIHKNPSRLTKVKDLSTWECNSSAVNLTQAEQQHLKQNSIR